MDKKPVICPVCNKPIIHLRKNWDDIVRLYPEIIDQVDMFGEKSLTENEQVLYLNQIHAGCYHLLNKEYE
jgi:hypothetical protein